MDGLKIDTSKAYECVEWGFLELVLLKLWFNHKIMEFFMACIMSICYQITHARKSFGSIVPKQDIRQGDLLSSYLLLICMEAFTALIHDFEAKRLIRRIKAVRSAPSISHMFFTDDSYIICRASAECRSHGISPYIFEKTSRQKINPDKSSVFFSKNTKTSVRVDVFQHLKFQEANDFFFWDCLIK